MNAGQELLSVSCLARSPRVPALQPVRALAQLAETLLAAAEADAILPETKLGTER